MEGKVAIVTGAGTRGPGVGVGRAISVLFAREGAKVLLMDINESAAKQTLDLIIAEGGEASIFLGNSASSTDCDAAAKAAVDRYGKLTSLVNNVAIGHEGADAADYDEDVWDNMLEVNLKSALLMTKHAIPRMLAAHGGSIINIGSTVALRASPGQSAYTAAKGALISLTTLWAVEQGRKGIRVNCICPGNLHTPMAAGGLEMSQEVRRFRARMTALGTEGTAWDVGWAAVFLASDESRWITGAMLPVDGGFLAAHPRWGASVEMEDRRI
jgi:NAD(P)-dependent dehydrogenase (short-subunit alcohol dehydrogenase family)